MAPLASAGSAVLMVCGCLLVAGCAAKGPPAQLAAPSAAPQSTPGGIALSRVKAYPDLDTVAADSQVVVSGVATGPRTSKDVNGLRFTVTEFLVDTWLKGEGADAVKVMQVGTAAEVGEDGGEIRSHSDAAPLLPLDHPYLLYLYEWHLTSPTQKTGLYMITGDVGKFRPTEGSETPADRSDSSTWQDAGRPSHEDFDEPAVATYAELTEPVGP